MPFPRWADHWCRVLVNLGSHYSVTRVHDNAGWVRLMVVVQMPSCSCPGTRAVLHICHKPAAVGLRILGPCLGSGESLCGSLSHGVRSTPLDPWFILVKRQA